MGIPAWKKNDGEGGASQRWFDTKVLRHASSYWFLSDSIYFSGTQEGSEAYNPSVYSNAGFHYRHKGALNGLFADGHVQVGNARENPRRMAETEQLARHACRSASNGKLSELLLKRRRHSGRIPGEMVRASPFHQGNIPSSGPFNKGNHSSSPFKQKNAAVS